MRDSQRTDRPARKVRRERRFYTARVSLHSPRLSARLLNLSTAGAAIETTDQPRIGAKLLCELESEQTLALIPGEVRWCRLGRTTNDQAGDIIPVYRAGIHFDNGTPRNLLRILRAAGLQRSVGEA